MAKDAAKETTPKVAEEKKDNKYQKPAKPEQPDEDAFTKARDALDKQRDAHRADIKKLSDKINAAQDGKEDYEAAKEELFNDFNKSKEEFDTLRQKQIELIQQIKQQNEQRRENSKELRNLTKDLGDGGEEAIDNKIRELEYKMQIGQCKNLKEEKLMMQQIKELNKKKPQVQAMARKVEKLNEDVALAGGVALPLEEQIKEVREKIDAVKVEKQAKKDKLDELRAKRMKQREAVRGEIDQKDAIKKKMDEIYNEKKKISDEHWEKKRAFQNWEWECRQIERKIREDRWEKEQEAWEAEQKKVELEKNAEKPHFDEMVLIEQTQTYLNNLINPNQSAEEEKKKTADDFEDIEGRTILVSKKDREQEFWMAPSKKKGGNKKKGGQNQGGKKGQIQHNMGTFQLFDQISKLGDKKNREVIAAPLTLADVPACLEKLSKKMSFYEKKIAAWEVEREKLALEVKEAEAKGAAAKAELAAQESAVAAAQTDETKDE